MLPGRRFKAVQLGGPSGGCLPESLLDEPIDYENLVAAGSMMGTVFISHERRWQTRRS